MDVLELMMDVLKLMICSQMPTKDLSQKAHRVRAGHGDLLDGTPGQHLMSFENFDMRSRPPHAASSDHDFYHGFQQQDQRDQQCTSVANDATRSAADHQLAQVSDAP